MIFIVSNQSLPTLLDYSLTMSYSDILGDSMNIKSTLLLVVLLLSSSMAWAASFTGNTAGTIQFRGAVNEPTCNVTTNGIRDLTVTPNGITTKGEVAYRLNNHDITQLTMGVSDCHGYKRNSEGADALTITARQSQSNNLGYVAGTGMVISYDGKHIVTIDYE